MGTGKRRSLPVLQRPQTRAECKDGPRPCPWVSCRYHLLLQVCDDGRLSMNRPKSSPGRRKALKITADKVWFLREWQDHAVDLLGKMEITCALDVAEIEQGLTFRGIGELIGMPKQNAEKELAAALRKIRAARDEREAEIAKGLEELRGA